MRKDMAVIVAYLFLILLVIIASMLNPSFTTYANFRNLYNMALPYLFMGFAQTIVILIGCIDLSVGPMVSLATTICATLMTETTFGFMPGLVVCIIVGLLVGLMNGLLVTKGRIQAIVVTLATSSILSGLALAVLPAPGGVYTKAFAKFLQGTLPGFHAAPYVIGGILIVVIWLMMNRTRLGKNIMATGGNEDAAYNSGINTDRVKIIAFMLCGMLSALAGVLIASRISAGDPLIGAGLTLNVIAVTVLGGTSLMGGKGGIIGTIAGIFILLIINNILNLIGVPSFYQYVMLGVLLIAALSLSSLKIRRK